MVLRMENVPSDLTPEECQELENIRRRKQELLADIQRLKDEIAEVTNEIENLGSTEERKTMQRNKQVAMGRKKFNMDPKKGIQFLIENDLLKNTCDDIAQFLYKGEGLNKTAIGDYLGERDEFNIQVLHSFVELHEFTDLNLVQALRQFLWSFRLPGEAQKIDRMMEAFAQRYCQCNPGVFQSTDTCYVLSFAIIMLNTSLHNPNVKDKPTVERFIAMNRGINDGGDLPEELLRNLYDSIKNEPFKIPEDDGNDLTHTFFNPDREGWLLKLGECFQARHCLSHGGRGLRLCPGVGRCREHGARRHRPGHFSVWGSVIPGQHGALPAEVGDASTLLVSKHVLHGGSWLRCSESFRGSQSPVRDQPVLVVIRGKDRCMQGRGGFCGCQEQQAKWGSLSPVLCHNSPSRSSRLASGAALLTSTLQAGPWRRLNASWLCADWQCMHGLGEASTSPCAAAGHPPPTPSVLSFDLPRIWLDQAPRLVWVLLLGLLNPLESANQI
uniref:Cytohesin 1 n=1 Tax=Varanus komodoensis TaxID=61221 RepID=A0A8D2IWI7_VARKO